MAIPIASAVAAYTNAAKSAVAGVASIDGGGGVAGGGFGDMLKQAINSSIGTIKEGETQSMKALSGKSDIGTVVAAVSNAQLTLQTVTAVRDRVISAYQSIMQMAI